MDFYTSMLSTTFAIKPTSKSFIIHHTQNYTTQIIIFHPFFRPFSQKAHFLTITINFCCDSFCLFLVNENSYVLILSKRMENIFY